MFKFLSMQYKESTTGCIDSIYSRHALSGVCCLALLKYFLNPRNTMFFNMPCFCTHSLFWNVFPPCFLKCLLLLFQYAVQNIASSGKSSLSPTKISVTPLCASIYYLLPFFVIPCGTTRAIIAQASQKYSDEGPQKYKYGSSSLTTHLIFRFSPLDS